MSNFADVLMFGSLNVLCEELLSMRKKGPELKFSGVSRAGALNLTCGNG